MKQRRSRLALLGVMALALCVTLGLMAGAADAKKKGKKKSAKQVVVAKTTPTAIPAGDGTNQVAGLATVPLNVGKKAKGKVVNANNLFITYQLSDPAGHLDDIDLKLFAPNGRAIFLDNPSQFFGAAGTTLTVVGPLTLTPNSGTDYCFPNPTPPPPGCPAGDPDANLGPPFAGTARDFDLEHFAGVPARRTWTLKVLNFSTETTHVLNSFRMQLGLVNKPK